MANDVRVFLRSGASFFRPRAMEPINVNRNDLIGVELEHILASESFKGSKRCQAFLKYVVERATSGYADQLKERTLGIELFGRDPAYDTGEDAIVRVKANEVRKRLAQYSMGAAPERRVRIELPPGAYVPQFDWYQEPTREKKSKKYVSIKWLAVVSSLLLSIAGIVYSIGLPRNPLELFWEPLIAGTTAPIVCLGHPDVYIPIDGEPPSNYVASYPAQQLKPVAYVENKLNTHPAVELIRDGYVGIGDSNAGFLVGRALQSLGKGSQARLGDDVSFSDLKKSPAVLVGGFSNRWTMSMTSGLRFSFAEQDQKRVIVDHNQPGKVWSVPSLSKTGHATEDYALVSRLLVSRTGQVLISIAGISGYGSQAAGEFVTDSLSLKKLASSAPKNWENMNMQVLLRTKVVGETPTPAEVVATYYWR